jgi:uncharacterized Zn finger protein (UPF0148 family)
MIGHCERCGTVAVLDRHGLCPNCSHSMAMGFIEEHARNNEELFVTVDKVA